MLTPSSKTIHSYRTACLLAVMVCSGVILSGCYEKEAALVPLTSEDKTVSSPAITEVRAKAPGRTAPGPALDEAAIQTLKAEIRVISARLLRASKEAATSSAQKDWRSPEVDKLKELLSACCLDSTEHCSQCLKPIANAQLPAAELWPLIGQFLGPLRDKAQLGIIELGKPLFTHPNGEFRDRIYRMAVGAGVSRRGQPDQVGRRASSIPLVPEPGAPVWLMVEQLSPCPRLTAEVKGPDRNGRVDLALEDLCTPEQWAEVSAAFPPRASRGVWSIPIKSMPMAGIELWMNEAEQPLLTLRAGKTTANESSDSQGTSPAATKANKKP